MIQCRDRPSLPLEALAEFTLRHFECDAPVQPGVAGLVHFAHTARADRRKNFVRAEFVAYRKGHMRDSTKAYSIRKWIGNETAHFPFSTLLVCRFGAGGSPRMSCGTWSEVAASERDWIIL